MNKNSRRPAGMVAINAQLTAIAGQPATLKQLLVCFKNNALLRRAFRYALQAQLNPKVKKRPRLPKVLLPLLPKPTTPAEPVVPAPNKQEPSCQEPCTLGSISFKLALAHPLIEVLQGHGVVYDDKHGNEIAYGVLCEDFLISGSGGCATENGGTLGHDPEICKAGREEAAK